MGTQLVLLVMVILYSLSAGAIDTSVKQIMDAFYQWMIGGQLSIEQQAIVQLRLPRILLALFVGSALAGAGVASQGLFRNPLADPAMIGVAAGAALGAAISIVILNQLVASMTPAIIALGAFIGGLSASFLVWLIGYKSGGTATLLLAGIAINAIVFAAIGLLQYLANDQQLRDITFWSLGSLNAASWQRLQWIAPCVVVSLIVLLSQTRALNALLLGENEAMFLGFNVKRTQHLVIFFTALAVSSAVAFTGVISFVGLVVPHLLRLIIGPDHRVLLPASIIGGAILVALADVMARTLAAPADLPLGVLISLVGGPFFLYLLLRSPWRNE